MKDEKEDKRMQVFELEKYIGKNVEVSFFGGIQLSGRFMGYDKILNIVLEEAKITKAPNEETAEAMHLWGSGPSTITCKGASICSIVLL
ncbi:U6 snRNA-associated Sm-like protein LSm7 [Nematocida sp. LUAm3]|nr:U6 snRNA-associated Sm-like protein LSm7 [Nematocida sp. LUAm3]KAI5174818.1 U6 snRNA-associated Sm-like protein LSm7 [Nematocida sp. LUAm2]KAI5177427.1 U6 snRNA-associated Sm-like protein LSm7 [Nematocida sp. LUAm1]